MIRDNKEAKKTAYQILFDAYAWTLDEEKAINRRLEDIRRNREELKHKIRAAGSCEHGATFLQIVPSYLSHEGEPNIYVTRCEICWRYSRPDESGAWHTGNPERVGVEEA
ncbi:MAG TPA: hypothetical protein VF077_00510 [Nitrospiraceae bacterium]